MSREFQTGDIIKLNGRICYVGAFNRKKNRRQVIPVEWDGQRRLVTRRLKPSRWLKPEEISQKAQLIWAFKL